ATIHNNPASPARGSRWSRAGRRNGGMRVPFPPSRDGLRTADEKKAPLRKAAPLIIETAGVRWRLCLPLILFLAAPADHEAQDAQAESQQADFTRLGYLQRRADQIA